MARSKARWQVQLEYYPLRFLFWLLSLLPGVGAYRISQLLLRGLWTCLPKRRRIADENLSQAFPDLDPPARQQLALDSLSNLSRGITIFTKIPRFDAQDWR